MAQLPGHQRASLKAPGINELAAGAGACRRVRVFASGHRVTESNATRHGVPEKRYRGKDECTKPSCLTWDASWSISILGAAIKLWRNSAPARPPRFPKGWRRAA